MSDLDQQIRAWLIERWDNEPGATADALGAVLDYADRLEPGVPAVAAGIRQAIATHLHVDGTV